MLLKWWSSVHYSLYCLFLRFWGTCINHLIDYKSRPSVGLVTFLNILTRIKIFTSNSPICHQAWRSYKLINVELTVHNISSLSIQECVLLSISSLYITTNCLTDVLNKPVRIRNSVPLKQYCPIKLYVHKDQMYILCLLDRASPW
jgi:hypothetical protein